MDQRSASTDLPLLVAITGASGVIYGVEMLRALKALGQTTHLILSEAAGLNMALETNYSLDEVRALADVVYPNKDVGAAVASGINPAVAAFLSNGSTVVAAANGLRPLLEKRGHRDQAA